MLDSFNSGNPALTAKKLFFDLWFYLPDERADLKSTFNRGILGNVKRIIFAMRRLASDLKSILKRIYRSTFFKHFARTVRNTKNRSIGIVFQYIFTIKLVIICVLYS